MTEIEIYDAMNTGGWDAIQEAREGAYSADQTRPEDAPEDWLAPRERFDADYGAAYAHYQKDHEAPQTQREKDTREAVAEENTAASEAVEGL
jgi:hypothetical protein